MKEQFMERNTAVLVVMFSSAEQENLHDHPVEEKCMQSATQDLQSDIEEVKVSLQNKTLALQRIQIMGALRNKLIQDDEDSRLILKTIENILVLSQKITEYQQKIIFGSGINWAEDPSLKAIIPQLEENVYLQ
ncbi:hypothetical protein TURU_020197 [Turdus rufiventris]|nr:hypothetical protein TURU_020197 [Turdus rufiventris]